MVALVGSFAPLSPTVLGVAQAQQARTVTVLAGAGQDTVDILSYFPQNVRVHVGDTVTWKQNSDASHTISFFGTFTGPGGANVFAEPGTLVPSPNLPIAGRTGVNQANRVQRFPYPGPEANGSVYHGEGMVSSGRLRGVPQTPGLPPLESWSLTFDRPGLYNYICLTHADQMHGTVEVVDTSASVPGQAEIDAKAQQEITSMMDIAERAKAQRSNNRSEPGPNDTTTWYVSAGNHLFQLNDPRVQLQEFMPRNVTITAGDSVVWGSTGFHTVTFNPTPPAPPDNYLETLPDGTEAIVNNPMTRDPAKPSAIYDPAQFFNSGNLSPNQPNGTAWMLTFETPGTFEYYCSVHLDLGMVGTVTVVSRSPPS